MAVPLTPKRPGCAACRARGPAVWAPQHGPRSGLQELQERALPALLSAAAVAPGQQGWWAAAAAGARRCRPGLPRRRQLRALAGRPAPAWLPQVGEWLGKQLLAGSSSEGWRRAGPAPYTSLRVMALQRVDSNGRTHRNALPWPHINRGATGIGERTSQSKKARRCPGWAPGLATKSAGSWVAEGEGVFAGAIGPSQPSPNPICLQLLQSHQPQHQWRPP